MRRPKRRQKRPKTTRMTSRRIHRGQGTTALEQGLHDDDDGSPPTAPTAGATTATPTSTARVTMTMTTTTTVVTKRTMTSTVTRTPGAVAAPARPARNKSKGRPIVLGERLSRAGSPAVAPAVVRGARQRGSPTVHGPDCVVPIRGSRSGPHGIRLVSMHQEALMHALRRGACTGVSLASFLPWSQFRQRTPYQCKGLRPIVLH